MNIFSLYYLGSALFVLGSIVSPIFSAIGMVLTFIGHFMGTLILQSIYKKTTMEDKHDIYWILLAMKFGVLAHLLFIVGELFYQPLIGLSTEISTYLFLFLLTFSVAQRMVPFFSHSLASKNDVLLKIIFSLLLLHIVLEGVYTNSSFLVDILIGTLIAKELLRWELEYPHPNPLLWILHTALYWVPIAFIVGGLVNLISFSTNVSFLLLDIHLLLLGFVFTMLIGFGTRVTLGHSGNTMQADTWTKRLFMFTQVVVVLRILVSLVASLGWNFIILFDISITAWLLFFVAWTVRFFQVLISGKRLS